MNCDAADLGVGAPEPSPQTGPLYLLKKNLGENDELLANLERLLTNDCQAHAGRSAALHLWLSSVIRSHAFEV